MDLAVTVDSRRFFQGARDELGVFMEDNFRVLAFNL